MKKNDIEKLNFDLQNVGISIETLVGKITVRKTAFQDYPGLIISLEKSNKAYAEDLAIMEYNDTDMVIKAFIFNNVEKEKRDEYSDEIIYNFSKKLKKEAYLEKTNSLTSREINIWTPVGVLKATTSHCDDYPHITVSLISLDDREEIIGIFEYCKPENRLQSFLYAEDNENLRDEWSHKFVYDFI